MVCIPLNASSILLKDKKVFGNYQDGFPRSKSCLTNTIALQKEMDDWLGEWKKSRRYFPSWLYGNLKCGLPQQLYPELRDMDTWLNYRAGGSLGSSVAVSSLKFSWWLVMSAILQASVLGSLMFNVFIHAWEVEWNWQHQCVVTNTFAGHGWHLEGSWEAQ